MVETNLATHGAVEIRSTDLDEALKKLQSQLGSFLEADLLEVDIKLAIRYLFSDFLLLFLFGRYLDSIKLMSRSGRSSCDLKYFDTVQIRVTVESAIT